MKIALDAMGGDHAPASEVEGAALAVREYGVEVVLVGDDTLLKAELRRQGVGDLPGLTVHHASQRVEMHEQPSQVVRRKRDSSIWVGTELVKKGEAVAIISAGNTGATVVTAFFLLGVLKGVERPAIATLLPTLTGHTILLDVGATVDCTPSQLTQFALMGHEYAQHVFNRVHPTIGLLKRAFSRFKRRMDYAEFGGALLLGVNGICVICHGRSSGRAIKNAIRVAKEFFEGHVNEHIQRDIEESVALFEGKSKDSAR